MALPVTAAPKGRGLGFELQRNVSRIYLSAYLISLVGLQMQCFWEKNFAILKSLVCCYSNYLLQLCTFYRDSDHSNSDGLCSLAVANNARGCRVFCAHVSDGE